MKHNCPTCNEPYDCIYTFCSVPQRSMCFTCFSAMWHDFRRYKLQDGSSIAREVEEMAELLEEKHKPTGFDASVALRLRQIATKLKKFRV